MKFVIFVFSVFYPLLVLDFGKWTSLHIVLLLLSPSTPCTFKSTSGIHRHIFDVRTWGSAALNLESPQRENNQ